MRIPTRMISNLHIERPCQRSAAPSSGSNECSGISAEPMCACAAWTRRPDWGPTVLALHRSIGYRASRLVSSGTRGRDVPPLRLGINNTKNSAINYSPSSSRSELRREWLGQQVEVEQLFYDENRITRPVCVVCTQGVHKYSQLERSVLRIVTYLYCPKTKLDGRQIDSDETTTGVTFRSEMARLRPFIGPSKY